MKSMLFRILALLIGTGLIIGSLEVFLMIRPKFRYQYNSLRFKNNRLLSLNNDNLKYMRPSELFGYEIIPNCSERMPVGSNSYGLIGREYKFKKDSNTFRILLLGDSIAWQDWSRQFLEEALNSNYLNSKYKIFEIWNAGVPSYDARRYYLFLKHKGINYKPDMVIIFLFMNDFNLNLNIYYKDKDGTTEYYFPLREVSKKYRANHFLMKHSYLYRFIILNLESYLISKKEKKEGNIQEEDGRYYMGKIKYICEQEKIPLMMVIFPYLKPWSEYKDYQKQEYETILKVITELKFNYVNLYEHLPEKDLYNLRERKEDEIHPSQEGHRLIANIIYNYLLDNFFKHNSLQ